HVDDVYVDNFEFSLFNNLVKIFVQGNNTMMVRDLVEVMKPVLAATGHKSYDRIQVTQGDCLLDLKKPLYMVPDEVIYLTEESTLHLVLRLRGGF
ncbi:hypothetical protein A2U01_0059716, partial [Trifolium medium]|nr:hypothetical protein [Trifolium medium]